MNPKGMTRADAIKYINNMQCGVPDGLMTDRELAVESELKVFMNEHPNYHVRERAWRRLGSPVPQDADERIALLKLVRPNLHKQVENFLGRVGVMFKYAELNYNTVRPAYRDAIELDAFMQTAGLSGDIEKLQNGIDAWKKFLAAAEGLGFKGWSREQAMAQQRLITIEKWLSEEKAKKEAAEKAAKKEKV